MHAVLECRGLCIESEEKEILHDISFSMQHGEILGIVGESGCGKSTLLRSVMGLGNLYQSAGQILFEEEDMAGFDKERLRSIRGERISMVFQESTTHMNPLKTIGATVLESMRAHKPISKQDAFMIASDIFENLSLKDPERILHAYPFELSGGMNQRVGIALAMLNRPSILLADEPTSALDAIVAAQIIEELRNLKDAFGTAIILVTHNIKVAQALTDTILVLHKGKVVEYGSTEDVLENPRSIHTRQLIEACPQIGSI